MQRIIAVLLLFSFVAPNVSWAADASKGAVKLVDNYIAVLDLNHGDDIDKNIVAAVSDSIRIEFGKLSKFEIIDRNNMDKILGEQKFQLAFCNEKCAVQVGELLGVGKVVVGSIRKVGADFYLTVSIVDVESGKINRSEEKLCPECSVEALIPAGKSLVCSLLADDCGKVRKTSIEDELNSQLARAKERKRIEKELAASVKADSPSKKLTTEKEDKTSWGWWIAGGLAVIAAAALAGGGGGGGGGDTPSNNPPPADTGNVSVAW